MNIVLKLILQTCILLTTSYAFDFNWLTDLKGENTGHTVCQFLTLPQSANLLATGQASSGGSMDATDIPTFVANTAFGDRNKFSLSHLEWFMGLRKEYLGGFYPIMDVGTIGFYSQLFTPGKIGHARTIDEAISSPFMIEYSLGITYARQIVAKRLSLGCGVSYLESHIDESIARGVAGSIDVLYSPIDLIAAHLYFLNVGPSITYSLIPESLPVEAGFSMQFFPFTQAFRDKSHLFLTAGIGARKIADQPVITGLSTEIKFWNTFAIRTGYEYSYGTEATAEGLGVGASLMFGKYGVDGAWRYESKELGSVWAATLKLQLEEILPRTAEQYYDIAVKHYNKKRLGQCEYFANKALAVDPNMWKAHALISKLHSEIRRQNNLEIGLIYTGNLKGAFSEPIEPGALGGLARLSTVVKQLQSQFNVSLNIESGNLLSKSSELQHNRVAGIFLDKMRFDVVGCGSEEINLGLETLHKELASKTSIRFLCLNSLHSQSITVHHQKIEKNGYRILVSSIVNEMLVDSISRNSLQPMLENKILPSDAQKYDLRILVVHDTWKNIVKNAAIFKGIDIIICGGIDQPFHTPMKIDSTIVISAGTNGEYVGNLILRFNKAKKLLSAENKLFTVSDDIKADSSIAEAVSHLTAKFKIIDTGDIGTNPILTIGDPDGVFPFISDRNGKEQVFLKVPAQLAEFPVSGKLVNASNPVISFNTSKIAFITKTDSSQKLQVINFNHSGKRDYLDNFEILELVTTPDGKWLYISGIPNGKKNTDIFRQRPEGGAYYPIIEYDSSNETDIAFPKNENLMAFCSDRGGTFQIYLSDQTGQEPIAITTGKADHLCPSFSPDGEKIAYLSDRSNFGGKLDIWIYDRKNKQHKQITTHSNVKEFCWLPDSKTIVFSSGINIYNLYKVETSNNYLSTLIERDSTKTFNERTPVLIQYNKDFRVAYTREYPDGRKKIFWTKIDGTNEQCIVNSSGNDWLPEERR